jgi:hypothetical protein
MHTLLKSDHLLCSLASQGDPGAFFNLFAQVIREDYNCYCPQNELQSAQVLLEFYCTAYNSFVHHGCEMDPLQWLAQLKQRKAPQLCNGEAALPLPSNEQFESFAQLLRIQLKREFARYRLRKSPRHKAPQLTRFFILCALITSGVIVAGVAVQLLLTSTATTLSINMTRGQKSWKASLPIARATQHQQPAQAVVKSPVDTSTTTKDSVTALSQAPGSDQKVTHPPSTPVVRKRTPSPSNAAAAASSATPATASRPAVLPRPALNTSGSSSESRSQVSPPPTDNTTNTPARTAPTSAPTVSDEQPASLQ